MMLPHSWHAGASVLVSNVSLLPPSPPLDRATTVAWVTGVGSLPAESLAMMPMPCLSLADRNLDPSHRKT